MTELYRLSGAGNDFLALLEPPEDPTPGRVRAWCRRGISLGADGVFVLRRLRDGGEAPPTVEMIHYNADGSRAELCANGTRCAALLAFDRGWAEDRVRLITGAGPVLARRAGPSEIAVEAPLPGGPPEPLTLDVGGHSWQGFRIRIGVPYFVLVWEGRLDTVPIAELGPPLRRHPELMPDGANVDFLRVPPEGPVELRVWERGVEAETLASGTGALAAALIAVHLGHRRFPVEVRTTGGFSLVVDGDPPDAVPPTSWTLTGDARLLARLEVLGGVEVG